MKLVRCLLLCASLADLLATAAAGQPGREGDMKTYYDGELLTINFFELPEDAAARIIEHNQALNVIYVSEDPLPGGEEFVSVIDAIPGDGFNPLWLEVEIEFNAGHAPRQLFSDEEIQDAVDSGEIHLEPTDEVYRCSVIGPPVHDSNGDAAVDRGMLHTLSAPGSVQGVTWSAVKIRHGKS